MNPSPNNIVSRIQWLDSAKGIAIFSVMICHSGVFIFNSGNTIITQIIDTFFMPLFFLCSGFVSLKLSNKSPDRKYGIILKDFSILIPFLILGGSYAFCISKEKNIYNIFSMLWSEWSVGYWFLITLFLFRISIIITTKISSISKCNKAHKHDITILSSVILALALGYFTNKWQFTIAYFPFFLAGIFIKKYNLHISFLQKKYIFPILFILALISFTIYNYSYYNIHPYFNTYIIRPLVTFTILSGCIHSNGHPILSYLGNNSLDIYCLHYFFIIGCKNVIFNQDYLLQFPWVIQFLLMLIAAIILTLLSILLSKIIYSIPNLHNFLFGR